MQLAVLVSDWCTKRNVHSINIYKAKRVQNIKGGCWCLRVLNANRFLKHAIDMLCNFCMCILNYDRGLRAHIESNIKTKPLLNALNYFF